MPDVIAPFAARPFRATVRPPGSKSLTNRALALAALSDGVCHLTNILVADDTKVMLDGLTRLGFDVRIDPTKTAVAVTGRKGNIPAESAELFCGNSGTTIRFLAAMCSLGRGSYRLDGVPRMRRRPIGDGVDVLRHAGVRVDYAGETGFPPVVVLADGLPGGTVRYGAAASSQFLSALLMTGPYARHELNVHLDGPQTSWPYVAMTMRLMDRFGLTPELVRDPATGNPKRIVVPPGHYLDTDYAVEPDASNAAYFLAAAAVHPGAEVTVVDLGTDSLQGDVGFAAVLKKMGASVAIKKTSVTVTGTDELEGIDIDLSDMPDQAQTLAVVSLFASGPTTIRGLKTLRVKETDRLAALSTELQKFGAGVTVDGDDTLTVRPPKAVTPASVDTYDDHRMAMSFAVAGTRVPGVTVKNAQCVNKTYPNYFDDLRQVVNGRSLP